LEKLARELPVHDDPAIEVFVVGEIASGDQRDVERPKISNYSRL
jgi:hypothetical protein